MSDRLILHVVGARPNFMKAAPVVAAIARHSDVTQMLVHSGQHYDANMSDVFFSQLGIAPADVNLQVGSGTHAEQTALVMQRLEPALIEHRPVALLVYGDVNSTLAAALVAAKLLIPVGHVEAGLRSFDRTMPEEINRIVTDQLSTLLFTPSREADENLLREGVKPEAIHFVGNVMIDSLVRLAAPARRRYAALRSLVGFDRYGLVTLHRPSNVDDPERFRATMQALAAISADVPLVFPVHPRTQPRLRLVSSDPATASRLRLLDPLGYVDFLALLQHAALVITDSGGIQEETTYLGIPCLTLRPNTERPLTTTLGSNILVGDDLERLHRETRRILAGDVKRATVPPLWDGGAGERIADILCAWIAAHA